MAGPGLPAALVLALAACGGSGPKVPPPPVAGTVPGPHFKIGQPYRISGKWYYPQFVTEYEATGIASWYGHSYHGRPTANGEVYDMHALTAAHPTLQLPSVVEVVNLENGRSLILRVNDRGPFVKDRLIDLSLAAARELGFESEGLAQVQVRYLGLGASRRGADPAGREPAVRDAELRVAATRAAGLLTTGSRTRMH